MTTIKRAERHEETWRKVKKLGSLLGDEEDIVRRKNLATAALANLANLWKRAHKIGLKRRIRIYDTLVKSILLYNSETWGISKTQEKQLDAFHRQQLRRILNVKWKDKLANILVYRRCDTEPLSLQIVERRWRFFGHVLRLNERTPAWKAMYNYFDNRPLKKFKGRPRTTIVTTLTRDLNRLNKLNPAYTRNKQIPCLEKCEDLEILQKLALNRPLWRNLTECIYQAAKAET